MSNAFDVALQPLPASSLVTPPAHPMPQPPAVAARVRHDQKKDQATKVGRQVLNSTPPAHATPPPAQNAAADAAVPPVRTLPAGSVAQMKTPTEPAPQMDKTAFTPAQYQAPNKGLEYLSLALGMLFPGAPIARMASGFAGGLNTGAQDKYKRNEQQAEQKYKVDQANAQTDFQNRLSKYNAEKDQIAVTFANDQAKQQAAEAELNSRSNRDVIVAREAKDMAAAGRNPTTGAAFTYPPATKYIKGPVTNESLANANLQLAAVAEAQHDTFHAQQFSTKAAEFTARVDTAKATEARVHELQMQFAAEAKRTAASDASRANSQDRSDARAERLEQRREAFATATATRADRTALQALGNEADRRLTTFNTGLATATSSGRNGEAPVITADEKKTLGAAMLAISSSQTTDPVGRADQLAQQFHDNPAAQALVREWGDYAEMKRRSSAQQVIPQPASGGNAPSAAGFVADGRAHGVSEVNIRQAMKDQGFPDTAIASAMKGGSAAPAVSAPAASAGHSPSGHPLPPSPSHSGDIHANMNEAQIAAFDEHQRQSKIVARAKAMSAADRAIFKSQQSPADQAAIDHALSGR